MQPTTQYTRGVQGVLGLARALNPEIGSYVQHFVNENFRFSVQLSNGGIQMSTEIAQDYEAQPSSVTNDRIEKVVATFRKA